MANPANAWLVTLPEGAARDATYPANTWSIDAYGAGKSNNEGCKPTYRAVSNGYTPYSSPADVMQIANPTASVLTVRINHIMVSGRSTAASQVDTNLIKRSSLNSGGTPTSITPVPLDSRDTAASATVTTYGSTPTPGTTVGSIATYQTNLSATGSGGASTPVLWEFGWRNGKCVVLHPGEALCLNLGGAVPAGTALDIEWEWTEETPPLGTVA